MTNPINVKQIIFQSRTLNTLNDERKNERINNDRYFSIYGLNCVCLLIGTCLFRLYAFFKPDCTFVFVRDEFRVWESLGYCKVNNIIAENDNTILLEDDI